MVYTIPNTTPKRANIIPNKLPNSVINISFISGIKSTNINIIITENAKLIENDTNLLLFLLTNVITAPIIINSPNPSVNNSPIKNSFLFNYSPKNYNNS